MALVLQPGAAPSTGGMKVPPARPDSVTAGSPDRGAPAAGAAPSPLVAVAAPAALPAGAVELGPVAPSEQIQVEVVLRPRGAADLAREAAAVTTPGSPDFGRYLPPGAFARRFGADPATVGRVRLLAAEDGLQTVGTATDGLEVSVSGPAARIEHLFHTGLHRVRLADGSPGRVSTGVARLPGDLAAAVADVVGLDDVVRRSPQGGSIAEGSPPDGATRAPGAADRPAADRTTADTSGPRPCAAAEAHAKADSGLTDNLLADRYGADPLYASGEAGGGQHVAIYELDPFGTSDIAAFDTCYFGAAKARSMAADTLVIPVDGGQTTGAGVGEAALDVENVSALAPDAHLDVYEGPNTTAGSLDTFSRIVADDRDEVVSTSFGLCEAAMRSGEPGVQEIENTLFEQAAAQGQTVVAPSGDAGSDDCGGAGSSVPPILSVDDPASQPYVLGVGGTALKGAGSSTTEAVWNQGADGGAGGGGLSATWTAPGWQIDNGVPGMADPGVIVRAERVPGVTFCLSRAAACREVPDVSAAADPAHSGVTVFYEGEWTVEGGTSSAAPIWAALLADIASTTACRSRSGLGFVPPLLYDVAADPATYSASFFDVTVGDNAQLSAASGLFPATPGYDMASGLGTPRLTGPRGGSGLAAALCTAAAAADRPTVTAVTPSTVPATPPGPAPVTVEVTGSGFESARGRPSVRSVTVGDAVLRPGPAGAVGVTVVSAHVLAVRVPAGKALVPTGSGSDGAGDYQVVVTTSGGISSRAGPHSVLRFANETSDGAVPTVRKVGPTGGPPGGGTVTVYGSGFDGTTRVTFGSVPGRRLQVRSDDLLTVVAPPESAGTHCIGHTDPATDVCQVDVVVTDPSGSSAVVPLLPPYHGPYAPNAYGAFPPPADCGCETAPVATEYDYLAPPRVTSVTAMKGADGRQYVSVFGTTPIVVHGSGFDILGYEWTDVGRWGSAASVDLQLTSVAPDAVTVIAPMAPSGAVLPDAVPVAVQTLASPNSGDLHSGMAPSPVDPVSFAPYPTVTSVSAGAGRPVAGPDTGGTHLAVTGTELGAATSVLIVDETQGGTSQGTTDKVSLLGRTLDFSTPPAGVGVDDVLVCTVTACSVARPRVDTFTYFAPGNPTLLGSGPRSGPGGGGTLVTLHGERLGFVIAVRFGTRPASSFVNPAGPNDAGDPTTVYVVAPAGVPGTTVPIRVETLASKVDGSGFSPVTGAARFRYTGSG